MPEYSEYTKCLGIYNYEYRMVIDHLLDKNEMIGVDLNGIVGIQPSLGMTPQVIKIIS